MKLCVVCLVLGLTLTSAATSAIKPWLWKPAKVETRLKASSPLAPADVGNAILEASCRGTGRGVAGRYSRFTCQARWGGPNGGYDSLLTIRILAIGTGKLCVVTAPDGRAIPLPGPRVLPERTCPR